jgi:hypothetical protein
MGRTPVEIAAFQGRREDVEVLFPFTSHIPTIRDWSVDGIISHVKSHGLNQKVGVSLCACYKISIVLRFLCY